jgi:hypothetical protein
MPNKIVFTSIDKEKNPIIYPYLILPNPSTKIDVTIPKVKV